MSKIEKTGTYGFISLAFIMLMMSLYFDQTAANLMFTIFLIISWILFTARSYHLENYLRQRDSKENLSLIEHIFGLLKDPMRALSLVMFVKPILGVKSKDILVIKINRLTYLIYGFLLILIVIATVFRDTFEGY